jgi:serine/threonine protein kinase
MKTCPSCGKQFETTNTLCPFDGTVLEQDDDELIGATLAGKYRIEELISQGGMGAVYRGTHVLMDKTVAVKVLHPALAADDKIVARFSREAKAASRISHPHALSVTDFGESEDGIVFLVMEFLQGRTLKEVLHSEGPLSLPRIVEIIKQVSGALDAAHTQGVVHRDLKSDNIMLVDLGDQSDWAKVLDFGIAKIQEPVGQDPALTAPNLIIGTPQYMSPEQCSQSTDIDCRSDIYSLGIILFEMLTGHVPFTGESPTAIMMKQLQEPPPSIFPERNDVPAEVDNIVKRALAKLPEDRHESAGQLAGALESAAETDVPGVPIDPGPPTFPNEQRSTDRILVSTGPHEGRVTSAGEVDESTVVRPRFNTDPSSVALPQGQQAAAAPSSDFNIWKVIVPSVVVLAIVFAVVYAMTGRSKPEANMNQADAPLASEPNSQPVQEGKPATGEAEKGIVSGAPSPSAQSSPAPGIVTEPAAAKNLNQPVVNARESGNNNDRAANENHNRNQNDNSAADNTADEEATPSPATNRNANRKLTPPSPVNDSDDSNEPPPPTTPSRKPSTAKPTPPPPVESQPDNNIGLSPVN